MTDIGAAEQAIHGINIAQFNHFSDPSFYHPLSEYYQAQTQLLSFETKWSKIKQNIAEHRERTKQN